MCVSVCVCACTCTHKRVLDVSLLGTGGGWHCGCPSSVQPEGQRDGVEGGERFGAREGRTGCMACSVLPAYRHWHCSCHPCARGDGRRGWGGGRRQESWCSERKDRYPGAIGITPARLVARSGAVGTGTPGGREEGQGDVNDVAVPLELSSEKRLDYEVVSLLPVWESKVVERVARQVPRKYLRARRRDCATAPWESSSGLAAWPFVESKGTWA